MPHNILLTGPPRIGKTTVLQRVTERLTDEGYQVGGVYCPECRVDGDRVGINMMNIMAGVSKTLAHVDQTDGPKVGRYRVNVQNIDTMYTAAFQQAFKDADVVIVDEIAPMQIYSEKFPAQIRRVLDAELPVLAAIKAESTEGIIGDVKQRDDIKLVEVTEETREELPATLTKSLV